MNDTTARLAHNALPLLVAVTVGVTGFTANAQGPEHLRVPQRGGMPGMPVVTGIQRATNGVKVTWDGPSGYYQVQQKLGISGVWQALGKATNLVRSATLPTAHSNAFFRVAGPGPNYAGAQVCLECHEGIYQQEIHTRHAGALGSLKKKGQGNNPSCLPCHTVGYGLPTGFVNELLTPHLGGVQCENCHGPAGNHAANENDPTVRPRAELAAQVCGGCHNANSHRPHFEQWSASAHAGVTEDMNPAGRISNCGRCHSGSSRLALVQGEDPALTVANDANVAITCVVCHDPHRTNANPAQLRHPVASTNDYFLSTSDVFTNKYDPDINVCGQCHNHRGATWTSSSRPPHHSPQYNILLSAVGEFPAGTPPSRMPAHARLIEKQCVGCHMQKEGDGSEAHPLFSGHRFEVETYASCLPCHPLPGPLVEFTTTVVGGLIQRVKSSLDLWALTKAPAPLQQYGALAWEYYNAGTLSSPDGTLRGPVSDTSNTERDEQKHVPDNIKKARFNLYLVLHDGSYGVHNGPHSIRLLEAAQDWVWAELNP